MGKINTTPGIGVSNTGSILSPYGIGYQQSTHVPAYYTFLQCPITDGDTAHTAAYLITSGGRYNFAPFGIYFLEVCLSVTNFTIRVTCLSKPYVEIPEFGHYTDADHHYIGIKHGFHGDSIMVTPVKTQGPAYVNMNDSIVFTKLFDTIEIFSNDQPEGWTPIEPAYVLNSIDPGTMNGLFTPVGGMGIVNIPRHAETMVMYEIASFTSEVITNTLTSSCILSGAGNYGRATPGIYFLEFGNRRGQFQCVIDCLHYFNSSDPYTYNHPVNFGYWEEDGLYHIGVVADAYPNAYTTVPLAMRGHDNISVKYNTTFTEHRELPEGWQEVDVRYLVDEKRARELANNATRLSNNETHDLNTYTKPGLYCLYDNTKNKTLNGPYSPMWDIWFLRVETSGILVLQTLTVCASSDKQNSQYVRSYENNKWLDWVATIPHPSGS